MSKIYGTNEAKEKSFLQDGVAPQCACLNIPTIANKKGRVFIPPGITTKGYLGSHSISNYGWIFSIKQTDQTGGWVRPRN